MSATITVDETTTSTNLSPSPHNSTSPVQPNPQPIAEGHQASPAPSLRSSLSWKSIRSSFSVSERTSAQLGWAVAFGSVLLTIIALSPAFKSQDIAEKAFELAEWTALKDYIEDCREELAAGIQSQACLKAMNAKLPPPPYVRPEVLDKTKRTMVRGFQEVNSTSAAVHAEFSELQLPRVFQGLLFLVVVLTVCVLVLGFESGRSRAFHRSYLQSEKKLEDITSSTDCQPNDTTKSSVIRHPPSLSNVTVRRRHIRNHPIYRHANLEEAIHEEDVSEIRKRLQNGEDVNQHWPYLIYRLAITPPAASTTMRLEIARLCLDFGADVNALKGWNGQSALMVAIHFGNADVAKLLIANGATVCYSPPESNLTALHRCVRLAVTGSATDALEIMQMLFLYGADANQTDRLNETALHKLLIDAWFSRDNDMAMEKLYPIAVCLLDHGASMPQTIKEEYIVGNPLWDVVHTTIWGNGWPEHVGPDNRMERKRRLLVGKEEGEGGRR
ncbi:ankyrin [Melanomma pulvis-pyrius CBS 109.77]|uniref:Ankyrin n=1 Tax=Melanomma pulvis-pyrius CBS 109.77 TaxID=1314802 RepID=A0A6A6X4P6_9PLEO|nr:ankyrin [Melanomma pulvis-pyrius CBS 109.77]